MPNRRDFILQTCSFGAALTGSGIIASQLESCKSTEALKVVVTKSRISIPESVFGESKNYLVKDFSLPFDVLVVKNPDATYSALLMKCTHKGYALRITPTGFICDNHGSTFDFDGNVTKAPAPAPLKKYPCSLENKRIVVKLDA